MTYGNKLIVGGRHFATSIQGGERLSIDQIDKICTHLTAAALVGVLKFDCADIYPGTEEIYGYMIRKYIDRNKTKINIQTKCVPDLQAIENGEVSEKYIQHIIERSRQRIGKDKLDLVQFHRRDFTKPGYIEAYNHLHTLAQKGYIDKIGVTNFDIEHIQELLDHDLPVYSNQIQYSVLDNRVENGMAQFTQEKNIELYAYGTLGGGLLSEDFLNKKYEDSKKMLKGSGEKYYKEITELGGGDNKQGYEIYQNILQTLNTISEKYNMSIAQVASNYIAQHSYIHGVIIGNRAGDKIIGNKKGLDIIIDKEDIQKIRNVCKESKIEGDIYSFERDFSKPHGKHDKNRNKHQPHFIYPALQNG